MHREGEGSLGAYVSWGGGFTRGQEKGKVLITIASLLEHRTWREKKVRFLRAVRGRSQFELGAVRVQN